MPYKDKAKRRALTRSWYARNPKKGTQYSRKSRGIPIPTRPRPELCELCGKLPKRMVLDHCHETGTFRGWLCNTCNIALGIFGDNVAGLERAIQYIRGAIIVDGRKTG